VTRRFRVAAIGAGIIDRHLTGFSYIPELFEVPVLCSLDRERGEELCAKHKVPEYTQDFEAVLARPDIDIVDIATPPMLHFEMARAALAAGKHVICEKPLFGSLAECDAMAELLAGSPYKLMPIFQYRFGNGLQRLKYLIDLGLAGTPHFTTIETQWWRGPDYYTVPWRGKWATELGGCLLGHAIHAHDMLNLIHGDIAELFCMAATRVNPIEVEDNAAVCVRMANGSLATLSVTLGSREEISRLRFVFHNLVAESHTAPYTMSRDPWTFRAGDEAHQARIDEALAAYKAPEEGYTRQFELFHASLTEGAPLPITLEDARRSLEIVTAAYHSARTRGPVAFPIGPDHPLYRSWLPAGEAAAA